MHRVLLAIILWIDCEVFRDMLLGLLSFLLLDLLLIFGTFLAFLLWLAWLLSPTLDRRKGTHIVPLANNR